MNKRFACNLLGLAAAVALAGAAWATPTLEDMKADSGLRFSETAGMGRSRLGGNRT